MKLCRLVNDPLHVTTELSFGRTERVKWKMFLQFGFHERVRLLHWTLIVNLVNVLSCLGLDFCCTSRIWTSQIGRTVFLFFWDGATFQKPKHNVRDTGGVSEDFPLKEQFTQQWKFTRYLLTDGKSAEVSSSTEHVWNLTASQHSTKKTEQAQDLF